MKLPDLFSRVFRIPGIGRVALVYEKEGGALWYPGGLAFETNLKADLFSPKGKWQGQRDLGSGLVTTAGAVLMAADWTNATATLKLANWHDSSTGVVPAAIADTALGVAPPAGVPARGAGIQTNVSNAYTSQASSTYTGTVAVTEWGLFTAVAVGTLWDHKVFGAITTSNGFIIQWTYTLTVTAGG